MQKKKTKSRTDIYLITIGDVNLNDVDVVGMSTPDSLKEDLERYAEMYDPEDIHLLHVWKLTNVQCLPSIRIEGLEGL